MQCTDSCFAPAQTCLALQVAQVSQAAKPLCWWALCLLQLLRAHREADLQRTKVIRHASRAVASLDAR